MDRPSGENIQSSALVYTLQMQRNSYFYMVFYIIPSVIFVICSYLSFWIDQDSVTARCALGSTIIVITITFSNNINNILPAIDYAVWLQTYFNGVLIFTCFTMLEYAVVNFCSFNYFIRQKQINETINTVGAKLSKFKKKLENQ
jgi:hypothetical protein